MIVVSGGFTDKVSGEIQIFRPQNLNCLAKITEKPQSSDETALSQEKYVPARQDNGSQYINIKISDLLKGKVEANPQILSGDIITVLEAQPIYIIGGVANPKQISTRSQMTLSRAIAIAGGVTKDGDGKKITIFRRAGSETKIIEADLEKLKIDQTADIILQAFDIVEVAQTGRNKTKFPPVIKIADTAEKNSANLPLRIID
ncbi:MAG: SLBB domain-containing protein [Acidobacteria bacterium]|nr:SLBB domain-containing protein [Acidobacteriota bacterium]